MIVHREDLSPSQKEAIEQLLGRPLRDEESVSLHSVSFEAKPEAERQAAVERLRTFLETAQIPRPGVSDEEYEEAILEALRSERPNYQEVK